MFTAAIAFLLAGFVKGVLGFGFPIIALIVLTLTIGLFDALALIIVPTLLTNLWQALAGPHFFLVFRRLWIYFLVAMIFVLLTSQFLTLVNVDMLTGLLGIILVLFAVSRLLDLQISVSRRQEPLLGILLGALNGVLTGLTGSFMIPSVIYMQALGFRKAMLIQAMGIFFALSTLMLTVSLGRNDLLDANNATLSTVALVPAFAGIFAGRWTRRRIDEESFQKIFLISVLLLGAYIVGRAAFAVF